MFTVAPRAQISATWSISRGWTNGWPMITFLRVNAFCLQDVELLDPGVGDRVVVRVGVGVDRASHLLLGVRRGTDDPVLDLGDPAAVLPDRARLGGYALSPGRDLDRAGRDAGLLGLEDHALGKVGDEELGQFRHGLPPPVLRGPAGHGPVWGEAMDWTLHQVTGDHLVLRSAKAPAGGNPVPSAKVTL